MCGTYYIITCLLVFRLLFQLSTTAVNVYRTVVVYDFCCQSVFTVVMKTVIANAVINNDTIHIIVVIMLMVLMMVNIAILTTISS